MARRNLTLLPGRADMTTSCEHGMPISLMSCDDCTIAEMNAEIEALKADAARLQWMQFHGGRVCWSSDSEVCRVEWCDRDGTYRTKNHDDWRAAIDNAIAAPADLSLEAGG